MPAKGGSSRTQTHSRPRGSARDDRRGLGRGSRQPFGLVGLQRFDRCLPQAYDDGGISGRTRVCSRSAELFYEPSEVALAR